MNLSEALGKARIVVCAGPGGVGKTTVAAAVGLAGVEAGRKTLVLTVDPARRLADAMGLGGLDNVERTVPREALVRAGMEAPAEMRAMMLNMKRTWDSLIDRCAPSVDVRDAIIANPFYRHLSTSLAGSHEYMAMEKLYEMHRERSYDLIALDTPPTRNAIDFLEAPERVLDALDSESAEWLLRPYLAAGRAGAKLLNFSASYIMKTLSRFAGLQTLQQIASFILAFSEMYGGFKERAADVKSLLASGETAFLIVCSPQRSRVEEAAFLHRKLRSDGFPFSAFVVNRVHWSGFPEAASFPADSLVPSAVEDSPVARRALSRILDVCRNMETLASSDRREIDFLKSCCPGEPVFEIPHLQDEIRGIKELAKIKSHLFEGGGAGG